MSCCEYEPKVHAYHDGELSSEERRAIEEHILRCPMCARELEDLRRLSRLFASTRMPDLPAEALERLHKTGGFLPERVLFRTSTFFAAAAAVVLLTCSVWLYGTYVGQGPTENLVPPWESAALTLHTDVPAPNDAEAHVAQWIVVDLTGGNAHD